jgi:hypothetical protein
MTPRTPSFLRPSALLPALIITGLAVAQTPDEMLARYRRAHHDESSVYLEKNTTITIRRAATGLVADRNVEEERLTLKTLAGQTQDDAVYYSGMVPLKSIAAYTLTPVKDKDKYRKLEVSRFTHKDEQDQKIFHDDSRSVDFLYPGVLPGAITHLDYDVSYPDARFVSGHFFATGVPVEQSTLTVVHDKDVAVDVRAFHIPEGALATTSTDRHGKVTDTYTMHNVPALQSAPDAPDVRYYAPHLQLVVHDLSTSNALAGQSDLQRLYHWYYGNIASVSATDDPEVTAIAKEAVKGATTDAEKAEKLYAWVQSNIKYVAVEDGMNGFIPFPAAKVCSNRYGDCKGMANLLRALLVNEGLDAHVAWTGSRELPYSYDELPSTATDDHMIVVLRNDTGHIFLDATADQCPYGMPSFYIQGKEVMMSVDSDHFELLRAPVVPAVDNALFDTVHVHVEGSDLVGTGTLRLRGMQRASMATALNWLPKDKWDDQLRSVHMKFNNSYQPDSITVTGREDRNAELVMHYQFRIPGVVTTTGGERFLPLDLEFPWRNEHYQADRKEPVERMYATVEHYVTILDPAPGATVSHLPPSTERNDPLFGYSCNYSSEPDGHVACSTVYTTGYILLPADRVPDWNSAVDAREHELNRSVVLNIAP